MYVLQAPFFPVGPTSLIAANAVAPTGVQLAGDPTAETLGEKQYRVMNNGAETVFFGYGSSGAAAVSACVIPTNASVGGNCFPIPSGGIEVITAKTGQYWSGITAGNTGVSLFVTPGRGV